MYSKKDRAYYNECRDRACNRLGITENQYNWFRREGEKLRKVYENNCNGLYDTDFAYEMAEGETLNKIVEKATALRLELFFQTDPRGATIYLDTKEIPDNNYTQAVCIY